MSLKLSICIPTYNRAKLLEDCLKSVLPQAEKRKNDVEVIVIDNASVDDTEDIVKKKMDEYSCLKYSRNRMNLGYSGNQTRCIETCSGKYMALLCDDDIYIDGAVDEILKLIKDREYSFIALNYYSFDRNINIPIKKNFAPDEDIIFKRAYDVMNYPSVGHYSGFILNSTLAKNTLKTISELRPYKTYGIDRGIITEIATIMTLSTSLPAYFLGKRKLATRVQKQFDYDNLYHVCIDYFNYYHYLFKKRLITSSDLEYRARLVLNRLPRAIVSDGPYLKDFELKQVINILSCWFRGKMKYDFVCYPLLILIRIATIKKLAILIKKVYRSAKQTRSRTRVVCLNRQ